MSWLSLSLRCLLCIYRPHNKYLYQVFAYSNCSVVFLLFQSNHAEFERFATAGTVTKIHKMFAAKIRLTHCLLFAVALVCVLWYVSALKIGASADDYKIVETHNGQVRGVRSVTLLKNIPFYSFKGIPYAKPPLNDLRLKVNKSYFMWNEILKLLLNEILNECNNENSQFSTILEIWKAPEPVESWKPAVLDAFEHGKVCIQPGMYLPRSLSQSEDCLTLNIYVPGRKSIKQSFFSRFKGFFSLQFHIKANVKPNERLAVLFFIHGGGFTDGSSDDLLYGPDFIIEKQVILVSFNYRLGVLGFLSLNSPEYSGNMGLKDQQLALKWISSNIDRFGGDSKRITIFGQSAGKLYHSI